MENTDENFDFGEIDFGTVLNELNPPTDDWFDEKLFALDGLALSTTTTNNNNASGNSSSNNITTTSTMINQKKRGGLMVNTSSTGGPASSEVSSPSSAGDSNSTSATRKMKINNAFVVDYIDVSKLAPHVQRSLIYKANDPVRLEICTEFKKKYYKYETKVLQCFPYCSKFPDIREARLNGLEHTAEPAKQVKAGWCSNVVEAELRIPVDFNTTQLFAFGRFLCSTPDVKVIPPHVGSTLYSIGDALLPNDRTLTTGQIVLLSHRGLPIIDPVTRLRSTKVLLPPPQRSSDSAESKTWILDLELPRHRRKPQDAPLKSPTFVFEILVFYKETPIAPILLLARDVSPVFEVASVRTLLREALYYRSLAAASSSGNNNGNPPGEDVERFFKETQSVSSIGSGESSRSKNSKEMGGSIKRKNSNGSDVTSLSNDSLNAKFKRSLVMEDGNNNKNAQPAHGGVASSNAPQEKKKGWLKHLF